MWQQTSHRGDFSTGGVRLRHCAESPFKDHLSYRVLSPKILATVRWSLFKDLGGWARMAWPLHPTWNNSAGPCSSRAPVGVARILSVSVAPSPLPLRSPTCSLCCRWRWMHGNSLRSTLLLGQCLCLRPCFLGPTVRRCCFRKANRQEWVLFSFPLSLLLNPLCLEVYYFRCISVICQFSSC